VLDEVDSTNRYLERMAPAERHGHAVIADRQTAGRGRRERHWHSPAGGNLYFSLGWRFRHDDLPFSTLPLLAAVAAAEALRRFGLEGHGIKWPNDILVEGKKLAGILVELKSAGAATSAIVGIGINLAMPGPDGEDPNLLIDRPWTDLASHLDDPSVAGKRNRVATLLLDQLLASLERFETSGFDSFRGPWARYDLLADTPVTLETDSGPVEGRAVGIRDTGELQVEQANGSLVSYHAGEVRVFRGIRTF
jgi:BirA family biotin operon repressor/biotin-[acetyl-CoA-carboxylase] ligase